MRRGFFNSLFPCSPDGSDAPLFEPLFSSDGVIFTVNERPAEGSLIPPAQSRFAYLPLPGTEVGSVRAQGLPQETVLYGLQEDGAEEWEGAFEIGTISGIISVGPNGSGLLVIVR